MENRETRNLAMNGGKNFWKTIHVIAEWTRGERSRNLRNGGDCRNRQQCYDGNRSGGGAVQGCMVWFSRGIIRDIKAVKKRGWKAQGVTAR